MANSLMASVARKCDDEGMEMIAILHEMKAEHAELGRRLVKLERLTVALNAMRNGVEPPEPTPIRRLRAA